MKNILKEISAPQITFLSLSMLLVLAIAVFAPGPKTALAPDELAAGQEEGKPWEELLEPADISSNDEFNIPIVPLTYEEGDEVRGIYYRPVSVGNESFYQVQPAGDVDSMLIPLGGTVIYGVETPDECNVKFVNIHVQEGNASFDVQQYQIFACLESHVLYSAAVEQLQSGEGAGESSVAPAASEQ